MSFKPDRLEEAEERLFAIRGNGPQSRGNMAE